METPQERTRRCVKEHFLGEYLNNYDLHIQSPDSFVLFMEQGTPERLTVPFARCVRGEAFEEQVSQIYFYAKCFFI